MMHIDATIAAAAFIAAADAVIVGGVVGVGRDGGMRV